MKKNAHEQVTDQILAILERGVIPWRKPWNGADMPTSAQTGKEYNGVNMFILAAIQELEGYKSKYWLTFKQAKERGGYIRKGEKSTVVVFWSFFDEKDKETGKLTGKQIPWLRSYRVFNLDQCEEVTLPPRFAKNDEFEALDFCPIEKAEELAKWPARPHKRPEIEHKGMQAYYKPSSDLVVMPPKESFESEQAYYSTLFHELGHSTGHKSRLDRGFTAVAAFGSETYSKEELVAEFASAMLCGEAGISPAVIENQASYIEGWSRKLRNEPTLLASAISKARKAIGYMTDPEFKV